MIPRALGKIFASLVRVQSARSLQSREPVTPRACALGEANSQLAAEAHPSKSRKYPKRWL